MFNLFKKKIVIRLEKRYYNLTDLKKALVKYFGERGYTVKVDDQKYTVYEKTISTHGVPTQRVVLKEV